MPYRDFENAVKHMSDFQNTLGAGARSWWVGAVAIFVPLAVLPYLGVNGTSVIVLAVGASTLLLGKQLVVHAHRIASYLAILITTTQSVGWKQLREYEHPDPDQGSEPHSLLEEYRA